MFCFNCGVQLPEGAQVCEKCGTEQTPIFQQSAEPETAENPAAPEPVYENEAVGESEASAAAEVEPESENSPESAPRLYQEPAPAAVREPIPAPVPAPMPNNMQNPTPYQAPPQPPQYGQLPPRYQQPMQPQMPPPPMLPAIEPFMKRKQYFKSAASEKIKGKTDLLSFFTGMGFGALLIVIFSLVYVLFDIIHEYGRHDYLFAGHIDAETGLIICIVSLSVTVVLAIFCIIGMKTKHFGFYIPLLLLPIAMTVLSVFRLIQFCSDYTITVNLRSEYGVAFWSYTALSAVSLFALIISVISLVLSVIVSGDYKKAQREYLWKAVNMQR